MTRTRALITLLALLAAVAAAGVVFDSIQIFHQQGQLSHQQKLLGTQVQQVSRLTDQVNADLRNQVRNRTDNVAVWCGHINTLQATLTAYVAAAARRDPAVIRLKLGSLPCRQLERATNRSAK